MVVHAYATRYRHHGLAGLVLINPIDALGESDCLPRYLHTWPPLLHRLRRTRHLGLAARVGEAILYRRLERTGARLGVRMRAGVDPRVSTDILAAFPPVPALSGQAATRLQEIPSLVLAGQHDPIAPPHYAVGVADTIWADYQLVPGAGHELPVTDPAHAAEAISRILTLACHHAVQEKPPCRRGRRS
jgi:pimeloyl-ACP methyl ester carboxylesterase